MAHTASLPDYTTRPFECTGVWWLPNAEDSTTAGTLRYSPKRGLKLSLVGTLGPLETSFEPRTYPAVFGLVNDFSLGRTVTLAKCSQSSLTISAPGFAAEELEPRFALCGAHIDNPAEAQFQTISLDY